MTFTIKGALTSFWSPPSITYVAAGSQPVGNGYFSTFMVFLISQILLVICSKRRHATFRFHILIQIALVYIGVVWNMYIVHHVAMLSPGVLRINLFRRQNLHIFYLERSLQANYVSFEQNLKTIPRFARKLEKSFKINLSSEVCQCQPYQSHFFGFDSFPN